MGSGTGEAVVRGRLRRRGSRGGEGEFMVQVSCKGGDSLDCGKIFGFGALMREKDWVLQ